MERIFSAAFLLFIGVGLLIVARRGLRCAYQLAEPWPSSGEPTRGRAGSGATRQSLS